MEEQEWQPVALLPIEKVLEDCPHPLRHEARAYWPSPKIIRVRASTCETNSVGCKLFRIHPEDDFGTPGDICEHAFLAD